MPQENVTSNENAVRPVLSVIDGGAGVSPERLLVIRSSAVALTKRIETPLTSLGRGKVPSSKDWPYTKFSSSATFPAEWANSPERRSENAGAVLQEGWVDKDRDFDGPPDKRKGFHHSIDRAYEAFGIDNRLSFGREPVGAPQHTLLQAHPDDRAAIPQYMRFPIRMRYEGCEFELETRASYTDKDGLHAAQVVMPGSIYPDNGDLSVGFCRGQVVDDLAFFITTTFHYSDLHNALAAELFGTLAFMLKGKWTEGTRQAYSLNLFGALARVIAARTANPEDGKKISIKSIVPLCAIETPEQVHTGIRFMCKELGDPEEGMRIRTFDNALAKLEHSPDAPVPGMRKLAAEFGPEFADVINKLLYGASNKAATELDKVEEQYVYTSDSDCDWFDAEAFVLTGGNKKAYEKKTAKVKSDLAGRTITNPYTGKAYPIADGLINSQTKHRVHGTKVLVRPPAIQHEDMDERPHLKAAFQVHEELLPDRIPPASHFIERVHPVTEKPVGEDYQGRVRLVFNTYLGWPALPKKCQNPDKVRRFMGELDWCFKWTTRGNKHHLDLLYKIPAHIIQKPQEKAQMGWVFVGDQGTGKSFYGETFIGSLLGPQVCKVMDRKALTSANSLFGTSQLRDQLVAIVNEIHNVDEATIKELVRSARLSTQRKFENIIEHDNYCRLIASSNERKRLTRHWDRALFYVLAETQDHLGVSKAEWDKLMDGEVKNRFGGLAELLKDPELLSHLMWVLQLETEVTREQLESLQHSAGNDPELVWNGIAPVPRALHMLVGQGGVYGSHGEQKQPGRQWLHPFDKSQVGAWVEQNFAIQQGHSRSYVPNVDRLLETGIKLGLWALENSQYKPVVKWGDALRMTEEFVEVPYVVGLNLGRKPDPDEYTAKENSDGHK